MKHKWLVVLMSVMLVLGVCACGQEPVQSVSIGSSEQQDEISDNDAIAEIISKEQQSSEENISSAVESVVPVEENVVATVSDSIPGFFTKNRQGKGTVEKITYIAKDYIGEGPDKEKKANVYLPMDYDPAKKYNVLYLMHGIGGNEDEWKLNSNYSYPHLILDNLFGNGDVEPFIVVTPNGKAYANKYSSDLEPFYNFGLELRNDLIPYIESHYSTYAEYSEDGYDLSVNRRHRAMAGLSMGGMQTINIGMCECMDLFSWFGAFSAAPTSYESDKVAGIIDALDYDIDYFYNVCGTDDSTAYWSASAAAKNLATKSSKLTDGENFMWQERSGGHDFSIWNLGLYNFSQIIFKEK